MDDDQKKEYSRWTGFGLILGVAIGSAWDFQNGSFSGITAAMGAGIGIVLGSAIGHYKATHKG